MIDLPDFGYVNRVISPVYSGGVADGSLGGPSDYIDRPGYRYSVQFDLPPLPASKEARRLETLLEQGSGEDVSYPFPLDVRSIVSGPALVDGSNAVGASLKLKGLVPGFVMRMGQAFAVILADGTGFIHKAKTEQIAGDDGKMTVPVFPLTRTTFTDGLTVEIERPRIRGILSYQGSTQPAHGRRGFSFTITERR
jgi:hypothetical protein